MILHPTNFEVSISNPLSRFLCCTPVIDNKRELTVKVGELGLPLHKNFLGEAIRCAERMGTHETICNLASVDGGGLLVVEQII